jgi:hypothetical protein
VIKQHSYNNTAYIPGNSGNSASVGGGGNSSSLEEYLEIPSAQWNADVASLELRLNSTLQPFAAYLLSFELQNQAGLQVLV